MAEEQLKIKIGADVSELDKGLNSVETGLTNLQKTTSTTGASFGKLSTDLQKINPAATGASTVLTNLSRVASDAPFGFIAIQNNLEPLLQSFGSLQASSGSTGAALKSLAASLAGPAGLAVGFSVVSSLVTSAIQQYGSLGNALSELGASQDIASVNQRSLNSAINESIASTTGEVLKIQDYVKILTDANASLTQRTNAYNLLKKEFPAVLQGISLENALTKQGAIDIKKKSIALIDFIRLKGQEAALTKLIEQETEKGLKTAQSQIELIKNQNSFTNKLINSVLGAGNAFTGFSRRIAAGNEDLQASNEAIDFFSKSLDGIRQKITATDTNIIDPGAADKLRKQQDQLIKEQEKKARLSGSTNKKEVQDNEARLRNLIALYKTEAELIKENSGKYSDEYNAALKKVAATQAELDITVAVKAKNLQGIDIIKKDLQNKLNDIDKQTSFSVAPILEVKKISAEEDFGLIGKKLELKPVITFSPEVKEQIDQQQKELFNFQVLIDEATRTGEVLNTVLSPVVDSFFSAIESGKDVFKALGDSIKKFVINAIKELVKLAAIAAGISILSGGKIGFGAAFKIAGGLSGGGGIGGLISGGRGAVAPVAGIAASTMSMSISGQFVQRGTDLVATISQANQRINRVG